MTLVTFEQKCEANNLWSTSKSPATLASIIQFNKEVTLVKIGWFKGRNIDEELVDTVGNIRIYEFDTKKLVYSQDCPPHQQPNGWQDFDFNKETKLSANVKYLVGFYFPTIPSIGIALGSNYSGEYVQKNGELELTRNNFYSISSDAFPTSLYSTGELGIRLYVENPIKKFLFYANDGKIKGLKNGGDLSIVPKMESNTSPSPYKTIFQTEWGGNPFGSGTGGYAFNAFDGNPNTAYSPNTANSGEYIGIELPESKIANKYFISGLSTTYPPFKSWVFEGSNNNSTWETLDTQNNFDWSSYGASNEFSINNIKEYKYFRIRRTSSGVTESISEFKIYAKNKDSLVIMDNITEENFIKYGIDVSTELDLSSTYTTKNTVDVNGGITIVEVEPFCLADELGSVFEVVEYNDIISQNSSSITVETEPFSVYDYISETPEVLVYTESTDDITISTTTEPFDIYEEFGNSVEVLYYTDDTEVTEADLVLEANYSPIDELEGDFEVVTWTDEEEAQRVLAMTATPKPQLVKLTKAKQIFGAIKDLLINDVSDESYRNETRFFVCGNDSTKWKVWNEAQENFVLVDTSTEQAILENGMTATKISSITEDQWKNWGEKFINIGVFLKDNARDTIHSVVESISYSDTLPRDTLSISDTSFYILNTTAKIDLALNGSVLTGVLSDDDLTRVQYRVLLNGSYYYPADGSFTKLGQAPQNIELAFSSSDIKLGEWNTVKVEFQDAFGTVDYWSNQFMGTYTGLLFKDVYGQYYSNEIGEVLQYLDFGIIIAGQTTVEHEIILSNQYGYDIQNIHLFANTGSLPKGMSVEFSQNQTPFVPQPELKLSGVLANNEELPFFVRLKTELGVTPDANGTLDIIVRADKV